MTGQDETERQEPADEITCPACGASIRARMSDGPLADVRRDLAQCGAALEAVSRRNLALTDELQAARGEVARYRATVEGVHTLLLLAQSEGIDSQGRSPVKVKELADLLAAALGDGE